MKTSRANTTNSFQFRTNNQSQIMLKAIKLTAALFLLLMMSAIASAQVSVTATAGTLGPTPYTTVKLAFDAINAGTHQGAVTIDIQANTTEGATPATLNSSGAGPAIYTSVLVRPTADGLTITGNPAAGFGVIQLKGADNVTIDGDNPNTGGTNRNLTINNTNTTTAIAGSVIRIATATTVVTSADNITIKNLNLNGYVTGGNASGITANTSSSNSSFGIYAGGNGGATATDAPTAITSVTAQTAPTGTTVNALVVDNNAINQAARGVVFNGASAGVSTGITITNNVIGASGSPSPATPPFTSPATTVYSKGIWVAGTTAYTISGNTIQNIISYMLTTPIQGIEINTATGAGPFVISNNTISGVAQNSATATQARGIVISQAGGPYTISGNNISNIQGVLTAFAATTVVVGIEANTSATSALIEKNKIAKVYNNNTGTTAARGINIAAGNNVTVQNNFVSDILGNMTGGFSFDATFGTYGIRVAGGTGHKIYHNSVSMSGAMLGTAATDLATGAFCIAATTQTGMDVRNNIFANTITGGTTNIAHVSIFLPTNAASAMSLTLNNNDYFSGTDAARQGIAQANTTPGAGFYLASNFNAAVNTPATNLRALTTVLGPATNDNASQVVDPQFVSSTDLHIAVASPMVNAGDPAVGVLDDIDSQLRVGTPDIGADEPSGVAPPANDIAAIAIVTPAPASSVVSGTVASPQASFKNIGTATQTSVGVSFTITGPGGYNYSNPQVIASINSGQTLTVTFAAAPAFVTAGTYNTTATVTTADANATNDTVASTFTVFAGITGGTVNVGTGEAFTSLTNPTGVFDAINQSVVTSNIIVNVTSDLTTETGTISLNQFAAGFTMIVQPSGAARVISGSNTTVLINQNGADGVTFSGLAFGPNGLTIRNTSATTGSVVRYINDASNNSLSSCIIEQNNTNSTAVLYSTGATTGNDNNGITGSIIRGTSSTVMPFNSIVSSGTSAAISNGPLTFVDNQIIDFGQAGILTLLGTNDLTITGNDITQSANRITALTGINLNSTVLGTSLVLNNRIHGLRSSVLGAGQPSVEGIFLADVRGTTVSRNRIYDFPAVAGGTGRIVGIEFGGSSANAATATIVNNMITIVTSVATTNSVFGIFDFAFGGNVITIDHNSVYIGGTASGATASWAIARGTAAPTTFTMRNNIAFNNRVSTGNSFAGADQSANTGTFVSNGNFFAGTGTTAANFMDYGSAGAGTPVSFATWQTGPPARDAASFAGTAASFTVANIFVDATNGDLHIKPTAGSIVSGGQAIGVTTDFDVDPRPAANPDIGADELVQATGGVIAGGTYYNVNAAGGDSLGGNVTVTNALYLNGLLDAGANTLTIDCNGTVSGASPSSYILGNLRKNYCGTGVKGFEIGTANAYSPVSVNATAGTFPANFTVKAVEGPQPNVNAATSLKRYWTLTEGGDITANLIFNYNDPLDIAGTESDYHIIRVIGGTPAAFPNNCPPGLTQACVDFVNNQATINGVTNFSDWTLGTVAAPTAAPATISGRITTTSGAPLAGVTVRLDGGRSAMSITDANGNYRFANVPVEQFYTVTPFITNYHFSPASRSYSLISNQTDATFTGTRDEVASGNVIDTPEYFVRQHYLDFLGREPDSEGLNFWSNQMRGCGNDYNCLERRTINVSAAYFLSIEFQKTGALVDKLYGASYGRAPRYAEFLPDTARVGRDVIVNQPDWEGQLARNTEEFLADWVERAAFRAAYDNLTNDGYIDALINNTGVTFTDGERTALGSGLSDGTLTRAQVLQRVVENGSFADARRNEMFVRMQYFGYLRRDPDDSGFHFWLNKLNEFEGNFERAEMVKAFLVSGEYRDRFRQH